MLWVALLPSREKTPEIIFEEAKAKCSSGIWLIENDAIFYDVLPVVSPPYPESLRGISLEQVVSFACSKEDAEKKRESFSQGMSNIALVGSGLVTGAILVPSVLLWWLIEEVIFWRKRSAKTK